MSSLGTVSPDWTESPPPSTLPSTVQTTPYSSDNSVAVPSNKDQDHYDLWYNPNLSLISPGLYLGNVASSWDVHTLTSCGIKSMLTAMNNPEPAWKMWDSVTNRNIVPRGNHMFIYTRDEPDFDNLKDMKDVCDWVDGQLLIGGHPPSVMTADVVRAAHKIAMASHAPLPRSVMTSLANLAIEFECPAAVEKEDANQHPGEVSDSATDAHHHHHGLRPKHLWGPWAAMIAPDGYEETTFDAPSELVRQHSTVSLAAAAAAAAAADGASGMAATTATTVDGPTTTTKMASRHSSVQEAIDTAECDTSPHVLVHCKAGMSRSASIIACWLMRRDGFRRPVDEVLAELCSLRGKVNLNPTFRVALDVWWNCQGDLWMEEEGHGDAAESKTPRQPKDAYRSHVEYISTPRCKDDYYDWRTAWSGEPYPPGYPFSKN